MIRAPHARLLWSTAILLLAAASAAWAQIPQIGAIDLYGLRKVRPAQVLSVAGLKVHGPLPPSKTDLEEEIAKIPGVVLARVEAVCCEEGEAILFIGIEERGAPHAALHSPPTGPAVLPEAWVDQYEQYLTAVGRAARRGAAAEDLTAGHSMMADPPVRAIQEQFAAFAADGVDTLREVLREGSAAEQRAVAAVLIGYAPRKREVVNDLQYALQDPDESVRANAVRSLTAFAVLAALQPGSGLSISATWFVEMLNSIALSDRVEATKALVTLTDRPNRPALDQIRERALDSLVEMAQWKTPRYALPPFLLLGRLAGLTDQQTQRYWEQGRRNEVIQRLTAPPTRKK